MFFTNNKDIRGEYEHASDEDVLACSYRHPALFEILVDRYGEAMLRRARRIVHDGETSFDIVQETFTKVYSHGKSFEKREGANFRSWIYRILFTTAISHYRREKKRRGDLSLDSETEEFIGSGTGESGEDALDKDMVERVLALLPDDSRRILELMFFEGQSGEEIAKELQITHEAARTRVHRAKQSFRKVTLMLEQKKMREKGER